MGRKKKIYSILLIIKEMQTKTAVGITSHRSERPPVMMAITVMNAGEGVEKRVPSHTVGGNVNGTAPMENNLRFLKKLKTELPYGPAIPL